jgi:tRNA G10  N-methylase Trm11
MMKNYIFILGRDPELSKKELFAYLKTHNFNYQVKDSTDTALLLQLSSINANEFIKDLAGIQKIGIEIDSFDHLYEGTENKVKFAISNYTNDESLLDELKAYFKNEGIKATQKKSHYEDQDFLTPSEAKSVVEIIQYKNQVYKSLAIFNPREYKARDLQRPIQRPLHTISIRLAKFLINLSEAKNNETLLDPFCGIGTILQEALLMNINVIGIDKEKFCFDASKKNLAWLKSKYSINNSYELYQLDSRQSDKKVASVDVVATEPYMGPFLKGFPTESEVKKTLNELIPLYRELLISLQKITRKNIVIITPLFRAKSKNHFRLDLTPFINSKFKADPPITYITPTSKMFREIWVIRRK